MVLIISHSDMKQNLGTDINPATSNDKCLWPNEFEETNEAPTAKQPYFYFSEQKTSQKKKALPSK